MDSAFFTEAMCCAGCGHYAFADQQQKLEYERLLWEQESSTDFATAKNIIAVKLNEFSPTRNTAANN